MLKWHNRISTWPFTRDFAIRTRIKPLDFAFWGGLVILVFAGVFYMMLNVIGEEVRPFGKDGIFVAGLFLGMWGAAALQRWEEFDMKLLLRGQANDDTDTTNTNIDSPRAR